MSIEKEITVSGVRWVKLGNNEDKWAETCITKGLLPFGYDNEKNPDHQGKAFYCKEQNIDDPENIVWITRYKGELYWGQASTEIKYDQWENLLVSRDGKLTKDIKKHPKGIPCRSIKWSNHSKTTKEIYKWELISGWVTKTASYQKTICKITATVKRISKRSKTKKEYVEEKTEQPIIDYIKNLITGEYKTPFTLTECKWGDTNCLSMVTTLSPDDFELFVANIYSQLGYLNYSEIGGSTQKDTDLILQEPTEFNRIAIQIKTRTTQEEYKEYVTRLAGNSSAEFVYHTIDKIKPDKQLKAIKIEDLMEKITEENKQHLLIHWLQEKCKFGVICTDIKESTLK